MKRLALLLLFVAGFIASCKTKTIDGVVPVPVDIRDRMVGTYDANASIVIRFGSKATTPEVYTGTVGVSKSTVANEVYLAMNVAGLNERLRATLTDSSFVIQDKTTEPIFINGTSYVGQYSATGQFIREGGQQKMILTTISEDPDLRKTTSITGTKK